MADPREDTPSDTVNLGPLDRPARPDRERAARALEAALGTAVKVEWASSLPKALLRVAGRRDLEAAPDWLRRLRADDNAPAPFGDETLWKSEDIRIAERLALEITRAAGHAAAEAVGPAKSLHFRLSLPRPYIVSRLTCPACLNDEPDARALTAELAASSTQAVWLLEGARVVAVGQPAITVQNGRLHALDGPAVSWGREGLHFWDGVWIPERIANRRLELTLEDVLDVRNLERRRRVFEQVGFERLVTTAGREPAQQDDYGRLWRLGPVLDDEEYVAVELVNSTAEPDGSRRRYVLRVPPSVRTAHEAVAWSFDLTPREYALAAQS